MRRAAAILLIAPVLAGCTQPNTSTGSFKGEEKRVAQVIVDLSSDATRGKSAETCDQRLSKALREKVAAGKTCASELKKAFEDADAAKLDVDDVAITGTTATAKVQSDNLDSTVTRTFRLVKEDSRWRIDSFG